MLAARWSSEGSAGPPDALVDALLRAGASRRAKDPDGRTAADHAIAMERPALAARLR